MRKWRIVDPDENGHAVETVVTEEELLKTYWPWWKSKMKSLGRHDKINQERCIEDWIICHWAQEIT